MCTATRCLTRGIYSLIKCTIVGRKLPFCVYDYVVQYVYSVYAVLSIAPSIGLLRKFTVCDFHSFSLLDADEQ